MTQLPSATYRLQLNGQFTFAQAEAILKYLASLHVSHIYLSPYLQAAAGSLHGYDVADHLHVNIELGGEAARRQFCATLKKNHLGQIIDIVPNHMAAKSPDNVAWTNVLKYGLQSPYAKYFDIFWQKTPKIFVPVLEADFEQVIKAGKIKLQVINEKFVLQYGEQYFPITPFSVISLLNQVAERSRSKTLSTIIEKLSKLSQRKYVKQMDNLERQIVSLMQQSEISRQALEDILNTYNTSDVLLTTLHRAQNYELVFWQTALQNISYRRFFHLNSLIGVRIEDPAVFAATHQLILKWGQLGAFDGIRVDHIDGLRHPLQYLNRLYKAFPSLWLVVEKILSPDEKLSDQWPVAGTTGYEFLNEVTRVFIDSSSAEAFTAFYAQYIGEPSDYPTVLREKKLLVLQQLFSPEVNFLTDLLIKVGRLFTKDEFSRSQVIAVLQTIVACFPRYRTYLDPEKGKINFEEKKIIIWTINAAKKNAPKINLKLYYFIRDILLLKYSGKNVFDFIFRFQQLTVSVMAKGGEDTALYCYNRFIPLNEVGGNPDKFGSSVKEFHQAMLAANRCYPHAMLTTSTHDTKRSEDVRARLVLLSEIETQWFAAVTEWTRHNENIHAENVPDRNMQYFLYQNLVGVWPFPQERLIAYIIKAAREAKTHTSWFFPNLVYEQKLQHFIEDILADKKFCELFEAFVQPLINAGRINSLSQMVLKFTVPGIPDIYQGSEIWNMSLVDPDNRFPINFKQRMQLFEEMLTFSSKQILQRMDDGMPKLWVTYKLLALRKNFPALFDGTTYFPVALKGQKKQHGIAFLRDEKVLVVVPRLILTLNGNWGNTWLDIPDQPWVNIFTDEKFRGGKIRLSALLNHFPIAVLRIEEEGYLPSLRGARATKQ